MTNGAHSNLGGTPEQPDRDESLSVGLPTRSMYAPVQDQKIPGVLQDRPFVDVRRGESNADYHADETYRSVSRIKTFLDSPTLYHSRYIARTLPQQSSPAMDHGTLLHSWLERGDALLADIAVPPESTLTGTGLVGKEAKKWAADNFGPDAVVVSPKERAQLHLEIESIRRNPAAMELIDDIREHELSIRWETPDGHRLKCRADAVTSNFFIDLKTTREPDVRAGFWKSVLDYRYHLQDAWYRRGMEALGMEARPLRFIVVSTSHWHDCQVVYLPQQVMAEGERLMEKALADIRLRERLDWWLPDQHGEVAELWFPAHVLGRMQ